MSARAVPPSRLWWLAAGFGVWCIALVALYALHAIGCAFAWSAGSLRTGLAMVFLAGLLAIASMWRALARTNAELESGQTASFLRWVVVWTLIAAFVSTVLTLGPTLLLATCL